MVGSLRQSLPLNLVFDSFNAGDDCSLGARHDVDDPADRRDEPDDREDEDDEENPRE
jgi:hypothetical protein